MACASKSLILARAAAEIAYSKGRSGISKVAKAHTVFEIS
eukprot:CAMPEP_0204188598 /NCGR_PEP_ID=MMETSP0361-20130328/57780_1 /ASSEMBLY_ACC=CAM_ASM_000343 /TAXON_ID=268821 /ORGANISM="Scrippsiella Hangoei, Strain SHTV-5" /LENGTH=39 /DNA_ID= /DNA_START= /DNA_END= /DNA_ORIENTATION=